MIFQTHSLLPAAILGIILTGSPVGESRPTTQEDSSLNQAIETTSCERFQNSIDKATSAAERLSARFGAIECILTQECAAPLTALLTERAFDRRALGASAARAIENIDKASDDLSGAALDEDTTAEAIDHLDRLRAFAEMFAALALDPKEDETPRRLIDACIGLALYADDPSEELVESAKLWQAVAYRRAGKTDRALQVLRPVLTTPTARSIGFYARVQRCLCLADRGDHAAALALAFRVAHRADAWFEDRDRAARKQAVDSVRWTRIEVLKGWAKKLKEDGQPDRAAEAEEEAETLLGGETYPIPADRWLPLETPIAGQPTWEPPAEKPPSAESHDDDEADMKSPEGKSAEPNSPVRESTDKDD